MSTIDYSLNASLGKSDNDWAVMICYSLIEWMIDRPRHPMLFQRNINVEDSE